VFHDLISHTLGTVLRPAALFSQAEGNDFRWAWCSTRRTCSPC